MYRARHLSLALILSVIVFGLADAQAQPKVTGRLISTQGQVEIARAGVTRAAVAQQELFEGDLIITGVGSRAAIQLADETHVKLNARSTLRIKAVTARPARGFIPASLRATRSLLELLAGEGWFKTSDPPQTIEIETPVATAAIRGTEFDLTANPDESRLALLQGQVEFRNSLGAIVLQSGELGIARQGEPPRRQVLINPEDAVQWSLYYPAITSFRDYPLVTSDRAVLQSRLAEAQANLAAAPTGADRQAQLGELLHDLGRREEARAAFESALKVNPSNVRGLVGLGWVALEEGRTDDAVARFSAVTPPTMMSLLGLSLAQYRRGDLEAAARLLDDAGRQFGPSAPSLTQRALLYLLRGEVTSANDALDTAQRLDPNFAPAFGLRSNIALTQNRKDDALGLAKKAVEVNPNSPSAHLDLSLALQAYFELSAALEAARKAVDLDPANARAHIQVARLLLGFDRIEEASEAAQQAQSLEPNEPLVLATLGFILLAQQQTDRAIGAFEKSIEAGSASGDPYVGLGLASFKKGKLEDGLRFFEAAVLLEPRVSLFQSYLAKALYQLDRREDGLAGLERAISLDPRDPTPQLYKGIMLTDLNRPADAITSFQNSIALNDNRAIYRSRLLLDRDLASRNVNLTRAYVALGQTDRALAAGIRALYEDPQSSSAHLFYGLSLFNLFGDFQRSSSELLQTQILQPVNQNILNDVVKSGTDYTMLIEQPKVQGSVQAFGGNLDTQSGSFFVTAAREQIAGEQFLNYSRTDGPKPTNSDVRNWSSTTFLKWAPTFRSSLFFEAFHFDQRGGDIFENARAFTANDPDLRVTTKATRFRLGYQLQTQPENNLLLFAQGQSLKDRIFDRSVSGTFIQSDLPLRQPFYNLQAAYLHRLGAHQLWFAVDYFDGRFEDRFQANPSVFCFAFTLGCFSHHSRGRFTGLVLQDTWQLRPDLYLTGALRYDNAHDRITLTRLTENSNVVSPQFGALWRATPKHTLRVAAFRSFQAYPHDLLSPTHMAGFFFDTPSTPDSKAWQYQAAWDADLTATTFFTLGAFHTEIDSPTFVAPAGTAIRATTNRNLSGGSLAVNQLLGQYFGVSAKYLRFHVGQPGPDGTDDLLQLGLFFVHPTGLSAGVNVNYVQQDLRSTRVAGAPRDFWLTDLAASYEFPKKWGLLTVGVSNLANHRFDLQRDPQGRDVSFVQGVLPVRTYGATLRVNF
jgi:tetratricopeptide (TPR) repeat protein